MTSDITTWILPWSRPDVANFGDRTRTGAFNVVWPYRQQKHSTVAIYMSCVNLSFKYGELIIGSNFEMCIVSLFVNCSKCSVQWLFNRIRLAAPRELSVYASLYVHRERLRNFQLLV